MTLVVHRIDNEEIEKEVHNPSFLLTNKIGGYTSLSDYPISRFQGVFFNDNFEVFKVIENIFPINKGDVKKLTNNFYSVERERGVKERFYMPFRHNSIVYELDEECEVQIDLDVRKAYDVREFGKYYKIANENDKVIITFTKKTDKREDNSDGTKEYEIYVVINNGKEYEKLDEFYPIHYDYDMSRNSQPWERYVYKSIKIKAKKLIISFGKNKQKAIEENKRIINDLDKIKKGQKIYVQGFRRKIKDNEIKFANKAAEIGLFHLINNIKNKRGIYAGLWWFFQYWTRDEAVSTKALMLEERFDLAKEILMRQVRNIKKDGRVPNRIPDSELESADGVGWVFKRVYDFIEMLHQKKLINDYLAHKELIEIRNQLEKAIYSMQKHYVSDDFVHNAPKETWMDTEWNGDTREGVRIEIQALQLSMYKLLQLVCKALKDDISYKNAVELEKRLKAKVRTHLFDGKYLFDGLNDPTVRPNVFLAHYIYPELLTKSEWIKCFEVALEKLWLEWGGIASIDKSHPLFCEQHTGQDNRSYHRGDSWFFLNNMAALCMARLSKNTFRRYIEKIIEASSKEILWHGIVGYHSEISSAKELQSKGCFAQAWSHALFIELIDEMY